MSLHESIAIGLLYGFFFHEWVGLSGGGFVVPGYIALQLDKPVALAVTLSAAFLTYGCVNLASRYTILYGRRRFILAVLTGFSWHWLLKTLLLYDGFLAVDADILGFIIPGLIANEMSRQRVLPTLFALMFISVLVRLTLIFLGVIRY